MIIYRSQYTSGCMVSNMSSFFIISIVNEFNQIIGIGYNGFPRGCSDDVLPWAREAENELDTKYMYVCHAEMNAILNMNSANARGCKVCLFLLFNL